MTISRSNMGSPAFGGTVSAIVYNQLIMPGKHEVLAEYMIKGGQSLLRGSVLGAITSAGADFGKMILSVATANDGSQIPMAILAEDLDTTPGDQVFGLYVEGMFNETALVFGAGHTANTVRIPLRTVGIYLTVPRHSHL